jgi:hypothetical protein
MDALMEHAALGGLRVFGPEPIDVDQRAPSPAELQVLQSGNRQQFVFGENAVPNSYSSRSA